MKHKLETRPSVRLLLTLIDAMNPDDHELHNAVHILQEVSKGRAFSDYDFRKFYYGYHSEKLDDMIVTLLSFGYVKYDEEGRLRLTETGELFLGKVSNR
jgi:uncharacterized protein YwgA